MNFTKLTTLALLGTLTLVLGCNTANNQLSENNSLSQVTDSFQSFNNKNIVIDDDDISSGKQISAAAQNKLSSENISKNTSSFVFKTVQILKGKSDLISKDSDKYSISGIINYYDDKNRLKPGANITVNLIQNGKAVGSALTGENGSWNISLDKNQFNGKSVKVNFVFANKLWAINGKTQYQWDGPQINSLTSDIDTGTLAPVKDSENAKAAFIQDIYNRYLAFFKKEGVDINPWWNKQLKTIWPGSGDYYSWGTVNLTGAHQWDVNGHEIGHAMTDIGTNSEMGGGQHKIDECYSEALAWSEGFATFLAGAISLERADKDARFEFLVPRRAPIRIENVPEDVCKGQKNEWRVSATMWDLYDSNSDGDDNLSIPFKTIWSSLSRKDRRIASARDAVNSLKELASSQSSAIDTSVKFNTMF